MALEDILEPSTPAPEAAPAPEVSEAPAPASVPDTPAPEQEPDVFDRAYVEKLRAEAAGNRTKYAPYRDVFESADDDVREYVLELSRTLINDPLATIEELDGLVAELKAAKAKRDGEDFSAPAAEPKASPVSDKAQPMTRAEWERIRDEEKSVAEREQEMQALRAEVRDLGYKSVDEDEYGDLASLLAIATRVTGGDLKKAHELRATRFEQEVNARVEAKIEAIRTGKEKWAPVSSAGTSPAPLGEKPKTLQEARRAANAYVNKLYENDI